MTKETHVTIRKIVAGMAPDWVPLYEKEGATIPVVIMSNHPRFVAGTRFDWGFVQVALRDGYIVEIHPVI